MKAHVQTIRTTNITLNEKEFNQAIKTYLKNKGVIDLDHYVTIDCVKRFEDERNQWNVDIKINNYNKDHNIHKPIN